MAAQRDRKDEYHNGLLMFGGESGAVSVTKCVRDELWQETDSEGNSICLCSGLGAFEVGIFVLFCRCCVWEWSLFCLVFSCSSLLFCALLCVTLLCFALRYFALVCVTLFFFARLRICLLQFCFFGR